MCILVVEDDPLIRAILVEELIDAGFTVREAETGDQAVGMLEALDPPLSLLVTDIHMPGSQNGIDLAARVRALNPGLPVIYTTGRPDALRNARALDATQSVIRKPYVPQDIVSEIRHLLGN